MCKHDHMHCTHKFSCRLRRMGPGGLLLHLPDIWIVSKSQTMNRAARNTCVLALCRPGIQFTGQVLRGTGAGVHVESSWFLKEPLAHHALWLSTWLGWMLRQLSVVVWVLLSEWAWCYLTAAARFSIQFSVVFVWLRQGITK